MPSEVCRCQAAGDVANGSGASAVRTLPCASRRSSANSVRKRAGPIDGMEAKAKANASAGSSDAPPVFMRPPRRGRPAATGLRRYARRTRRRRRRARQPSGRPRDLVQPAGAQSAGTQLRSEQGARFRGQLELADAFEAGHTRPGHATGHGGGGLPRRTGEELIGVRPTERYDQIEAVKQRSRDPTPVPGAGDGAAGAGTLVDALPAWAGVHGGNQEERRGKGHGAAGAAHPDDPLLERLAQRLQSGHGELTEFVEEQDAVGGQAHLARAQRPAAPAHQGDDGSLVVRHAEGRALQELAVGEGTAGRRVDASHCEGLGGRERREQAFQALGQHRLARSGRPDHQEVMATRRGNLDGPTAEGLASHVRQVRGAGVRSGAAAAARRASPPGPAGWPRARPTWRRLAPGPAHQCGLSDVAEWDDHAERPGRVGQGNHARDMAQRAVQPELPAEREAVGALGTQLPGGDE